MNQYVIYDIETYPNLFLFCAIDAGQEFSFEVSDRRDESEALTRYLVSLASRGVVMVGFNSIGFDYPVIHHCLVNSSFLPSVAYAKAMEIINGQGDENNHFANVIWENDRFIKQLDLFKVHHFDNRAKTTSLKGLEFAMKSDSIEDLPFAPGTFLRPDQIDTVISYCFHDVRETAKFFAKSRDMIAFREELSAKYGRDFLNHNDTKIGKDYFIMELEAAGVQCFQKDGAGRRVPRQTWRDAINIGEIIFPYIKFERPEFQWLLDHLKGLSIRDTKGAPELKDLSATVNGFKFDYGTGGIHGSISRRIVRSTDTHVILDVDVASMYPNIAIANGVYPAHLSATFCEIYKRLFDQRKQYAKGTAENAMLKLALNGVYGDSNNVYSPFYDPQYTMTITINGQLLLSMLAERVLPIGELIQVNTDGLTALVPRDRIEDFRAACTEWEVVTGLSLEEAQYSMMAVRDVNNYIAVSPSGKVKRKGAYDYEMQWHQDPSALVIPYAAEVEIVHGVPVEDFISVHNDPFDFVLRAKVPRSSRLETTDGQPQQNTTRYHIAKDGPGLVKIMPPLARKPDAERRIGIDVGWPVKVCNRMSDFSWSDLNRDYYVKEAKKLVDAFVKS